MIDRDFVAELIDQNVGADPVATGVRNHRERHRHIAGIGTDGGDLLQRIAGGAADAHGRDRRPDLHVAGMGDLAGDEGEAALDQVEQRVV